MAGLIINGQEVLVPGLTITNWMDDSTLRIPERDMHPRPDGRRRDDKPGALVHGVTLHSTKGWPDHDHPVQQQLLPGCGPSKHHAEATAHYWSTSERVGAAHLIVDHDMSVVCVADLAIEAAYHCSGVNNWTIGIEIYQGSDGEFYDKQLDAAVVLVNFLCEYFAIPKVIPPPYAGQPMQKIMDGQWAGVFGHRDASDNRGFGDPGDFIFTKLLAAGFNVEV
jgi:hypothetical protein